jgi:hypothetical protein
LRFLPGSYFASKALNLISKLLSNVRNYEGLTLNLPAKTTAGRSIVRPEAKPLTKIKRTRTI